MYLDYQRRDRVRARVPWWKRPQESTSVTLSQYSSTAVSLISRVPGVIYYPPGLDSMASLGCRYIVEAYRSRRARRLVLWVPQQPIVVVHVRISIQSTGFCTGVNKHFCIFRGFVGRLLGTYVLDLDLNLLRIRSLPQFESLPELLILSLSAVRYCNPRACACYFEELPVD